MSCISFNIGLINAKLQYFCKARSALPEYVGPIDNTILYDFVPNLPPY